MLLRSLRFTDIERTSFSTFAELDGLKNIDTRERSPEYSEGELFELGIEWVKYKSTAIMCSLKQLVIYSELETIPVVL